MANPEGKKLAVLKARELAANLYDKGQKDKAIETLIDCIKITPDNPEIYYEMIRIFLENKNFAEAWEVVESMSDVARNNLRGQEYAGYAKEGLGEDDEAAFCANKMLDLNEEYAPAFNLLGILSYKKGAAEQAATFFKRAIKADPGYGEAYTNLGVLHWGLDHKEEAFDYLRKGFVLAPVVPDAGRLYYSVMSALERFSEAEADFQSAVSLYPGHKNLAFLYIDILLQQGKWDLATTKIGDVLAAFGPDEGTLNAALAVRDKIGPLCIAQASHSKSLSLCMIVKNEEKYLAKCLHSVRNIVDEIIVVDTGSTDKTKDIATVFGARVFDFPWTGDFSEARNCSLKHAGGDWILVLDADEVISALDLNAIVKLTQKREPKFIAYNIVTRNYVNNMGIIGWMPNRGEYPEEVGLGWAPSPKVRLFPRREDIYFSFPVHELLEPSILKAEIPVQQCNIVVHHFGKLSDERDLQKGEDYYTLGKIKYEKEPENIKFITELAKQATVLKKYDEAINLWLKSIPLLERDGNSEASKELALISGSHPLAFIYMQLSSSYYLSDRFSEALAAARKGLEYKIVIKEHMMDYVLIEILAGSLDNAKRVLNQLIEMVPDYPSASLLAAVVCCIQGQQEQTLAYLRELKQRGFNLTPGFNKVAKQLHLCGKKEKARLILNAVIENKINDQETMDLFELLEGSPG